MSFNGGNLILPSRVHSLPQSKFSLFNAALPINKLRHLNLTLTQDEFLLLNLFTLYPLPHPRLHRKNSENSPCYKHGFKFLLTPLSLLITL